MLRMGTVSLLIVGMLSACGHTPQERAASGALIGATAGALVGVASQPRYHYDDRDRYHDRRYERRRHHHHRHRHGGGRRHRGYDWEYYD